ncbi:2-succinyl-5-enolpyruvyl-6-hydroxy-3-cyclohexene- 1-carboxylic-acid synthase [Bacillus carboniphilus]|uniref:2-succinyl-5-enolpyruvyl-6-hydroxy-3-cyclohexene-1-carboxylate synthase n=1 Tax=Bacillus carboniphilus TaxID=86663 RepID=A0ABP3FVF4_9BACI
MNWKAVLTQYVKTIVESLYQSGLRHVVISPGSRSTPLAYVFAEHPDIQTHIAIDERSASFYALGMAKKSSHPVALLCTSGTAAANYYPAVIEAKYARVPLVVLTADRPHELREVGAPQAIDQTDLYGKHVKWSVDLPQPNDREITNTYLQKTCQKAFVVSQKAPKGPVHLNVPLPEPLIPELPLGFAKVPAYSHSNVGRLFPTDEMITEFMSLLESDKKGLMVVGELSDPQAQGRILELSQKFHLPVLADPLSQLRNPQAESKGTVIESYDTFLRFKERLEALKPDYVIKIGATPVSKPLTQFLQALGEIRYIVIDEGEHRDPIHRATDAWAVNETLLLREVLLLESKGNQNADWLKKWQTLNEKTKSLLEQKSEILPWNEGKAVQSIIRSLPSDSLLFVGNSMPIRDVDTFLHSQVQNLQVLANRGTNGIDGVVSSALGASTLHNQNYLLIGDLSFYHDLNGLLIAQMEEIDITIFVLNNNGGGIFSFLPQSEQPYHFEKLFGTPANLTFEHVVNMYNGYYQKVHNERELEEALQIVHSQGGLKVVEIMTNREENVVIHRELWNSVSQEMIDDE